MVKDYYKILGVNRTASEEDIKRAFRKLAHEYHPDKATGNEAKFKEINEAYQVLSDKRKKAQYDKFGQVFEGGGSPGSAGWGDFGFGSQGIHWDAGVGDEMFDFDDIFDSIFGQFGGGRRRQTYTQGSDMETVYELTLEEAFRGLKKEIHIKTYVSCETCKGIGYDKTKGLSACLKCQGKGEIREQRRTFFGNFSQVKSCPDCYGLGQKPNKPCEKCDSKGRIFGLREVTVTIAPGVENGQVIKIKSAGEAGERGGASGDLYVLVKIKPHPIFERKATDLFAVKEISFTEALLDKKISFTDINGEKFYFAIPDGFNFKDKLKVTDRGMPRFGSASSALGRGDLYLTFNLKRPKNLSAKAKKMLEDLEKEL